MTCEHAALASPRRIHDGCDDESTLMGRMPRRQWPRRPRRQGKIGSCFGWDNKGVLLWFVGWTTITFYWLESVGASLLLVFVVANVRDENRTKIQKYSVLKL